VEVVLGRAGDPGAAGDRRDDGGEPGAVRPHLGLLDGPADEPGADEALVDEVGAEGQLTAGMELGDPGAGAGAARGTVEPAGVDGHGVPAVPGVGTGGDELDVVADGDTGVVRVD